MSDRTAEVKQTLCTFQAQLAEMLQKVSGVLEKLDQPASADAQGAIRIRGEVRERVCTLIANEPRDIAEIARLAQLDEKQVRNVLCSRAVAEFVKRFPNDATGRQ